MKKRNRITVSLAVAPIYFLFLVILSQWGAIRQWVSCDLSGALHSGRCIRSFANTNHDAFNAYFINNREFLVVYDKSIARKTISNPLLGGSTEVRFPLRITAVSLSVDKKNLAICIEDTDDRSSLNPPEIWIWDMENSILSKKISYPLNNSCFLNQMVFLPANQAIAFADGSEGVLVKGLLDDSVKKIPGNHIAVSSSGTQIATRTSASTITVWQLPEYKHVREFRVGTGSIRSFSFSPDSHLLAASTDSEVYVWNVDGQLLHVLSVSEKIHSLDVSFSSDSKKVITGTLAERQNTGYLYIWDLPDGNLKQKLELPEGIRPVSIDLSPDGTHVLVTSYEDVILLEIK